jgi:hypothetical protein
MGINTMMTLKLILSLFCLTISVSGAGWAADFVGDGFGAVSRAMGGAMLSSKVHPDAMYINPAALAGIKRFSLLAGYNNGFSGMTQEYFFTAVLPLSGWNLAFSLPVNTVSGIARTQENTSSGQGESIGQISQLYSAGLLSLAVELNPQWALGVSGRGYYLKLDSYTGTGMGLDAGLRYNILPGLMLGASARHLGGTLVSWSTGAKETYATLFSGGLSIRFPIDTLTISAEARSDYDTALKTVALKTGAEVSLAPFLHLRGGYHGDTGQWSLGAGLNLDDIDCDYAMLSHSTLGFTHQVVTTFRF